MIKIILYAATSIDGYIATKDRNSDWVSDLDSEQFISEIKKAGCLIVGRLTFEQFKDEIYPIEGVTNIVLTNTKPEDNPYDNVHYAIGPRECIELVESKGHKSAVLVGGAITNYSFLKHNFVDEIILSIHPLILGTGLALFNEQDHYSDLRLVDVTSVGDKLVRIKYHVIK